MSWTKVRWLRFCIVVGLVVLVAGIALAGVPHKINYQGRVTHIASGVPLPGTHSMTFRIYDVEMGGAPLWEETQTVQADFQGVVSTILGDVVPIDLTFEGPYWLEVVVDGETLTPRREMVSSGYAYNAERLGGLESTSYSLDGHIHDDRYYTETELNTPGMVNSLLNPVDWTKLKGVPSGFADGIDDVGGLPSGSTGQTLRHDGTGWVASSLLHNTGSAVGIGTVSPQYLLDVKNSSDSYGARAIRGFSSATGTGQQIWGVYGRTSSNATLNAGAGVLGVADSETGSSSGVRGETWGTGAKGVFGWALHPSEANYGVYGRTESPNGYGGFFSGGKGLYVAGDAHISGILSKGGGSFKIDHPLDPENRYLYHSFVESPDMMNIYNGNAFLDVGGEAWVELPEWFEALNYDFRYQLTAIGGGAPDLHIASEIEGNRFLIAGGSPGMKVSWQVTGIRQDAFARTHRIPVEEDKTGEDRGRYLHPEAFGLSATMGIDYDDTPEYEVTE